MLVEWHPIPLSKVFGVPTEKYFFHRKWTFRLENEVNGKKKKTSKSIENKCTH